MEVQVIQPFAPSLTERYNIGDKLDVDEPTAAALIAGGRVVKGSIKPYVNQPQPVYGVVSEVAQSESTLVATPVTSPALKAATEAKANTTRKTNKRQKR